MNSLLRAELHPDKHRSRSRANRLPRSLTEFYNKSLDEINSGPGRKRTKTSNIAFQCINARGSIAHGKKIDSFYSAEGQDNRRYQGVFDRYGGFKVLSTPDEIKLELVARGPVVSSSFHLCGIFLSSIEDRKRSLDGNLNNKSNEVLLSGWKHTPKGEVWHVCVLVEQSIGVREESFSIGFASTILIKYVLLQIVRLTSGVGKKALV